MGILEGLRSDPRGTLILLCYMIPAILISLTLHELSHGYMALRCGDPTAQMLGRLSFNPLHHLDPVGTVFMLLFGFGWARPVPINPRNFKHFRRDDLLVSVAGVVMNFCLFLLATFIMVGLNQLMWKPEVWAQGSMTTARDFLRFDGLNFNSILSGEPYLVVENATQYIQSVEGRQVFMSLLTPDKFDHMQIMYGNGEYYFVSDLLNTFLRFPWMIYVQRFIMFFARINLSLAVFNLLPVPPLDGYHVVNDIFLRGKLHIPAKVMNIITIGFLALIYFTGFISIFLSTAVETVQGGIVSGLLALLGLG